VDKCETNPPLNYFKPTWALSVSTLSASSSKIMKASCQTREENLFLIRRLVLANRCPSHPPNCWSSDDRKVCLICLNTRRWSRRGTSIFRNWNLMVIIMSFPIRPWPPNHDSDYTPLQHICPPKTKPDMWSICVASGHSPMNLEKKRHITGLINTAFVKKVNFLDWNASRCWAFCVILIMLFVIPFSFSYSVIPYGFSVCFAQANVVSVQRVPVVQFGTVLHFLSWIDMFMRPCFALAAFLLSFSCVLFRKDFFTH